MQIWKIKGKGNWVAKDYPKSFYGLRKSLTTFLQELLRKSNGDVFWLVFTDGEVKALSLQYRELFAEKDEVRQCHRTLGLKMISTCLDSKGGVRICPRIIQLPNHHNHDFNERFTAVPKTPPKRYLVVVFNLDYFRPE